MSEDEKEIKVTDRRIFTPDGELREGFEHLADVEEKAEAKPEPTPDEPPERPEPSAPPPPVGEAAQGPPPPAGAPGKAGFADLVAILAEPVAIYLGDAPLPDGRSAENLDAARLHIDLLEVLQEKTAGSLSPDEATLLEGLLYQLRMRYLQKTG